MGKLPTGTRSIDVPELSKLDPTLRVWLVDLHLLPPSETLVQELDERERERAARFTAPNAAASFVHRRWARRQLLSAAFGIEPATIGFREEPLGRPIIEGPDPLHGVVLSTSSSGRYALVSWRENGPLGVDIARVDPLHASADAARVFMSDDELLSWQGSASDAALRFFSIWTRKEAVLKLDGRGFATDATGISVLYSGPIDARECVLNDLTVPEGWVGAIAIGQPDSRDAV